MVATCEIINIGNELLIGKIVNSNASWLSNKITYLGYNVSRITVISDNICEIANSIQEAQSRHPQVIIITGVLGPTFDDITLEGLAKALNVPFLFLVASNGIPKSSRVKNVPGSGRSPVIPTICG